MLYIYFTTAICVYVCALFFNGASASTPARMDWSSFFLYESTCIAKELVTLGELMHNLMKELWRKLRTRGKTREDETGTLSRFRSVFPCFVCATSFSLNPQGILILSLCVFKF
uniref:Lipocalin n=1 Tax=Rhipicephalus zambeziensis TaxID=60191 RepID=A0A224YFQ8_9ACAR